MLIHVGSSWPSERPGGIPTYYRSFVQELAVQLGPDRVVGLVAGSLRVADESQGLVRPFAALQHSKYVRWLLVGKTLRKYFRQGSIVCCHYLPHILSVLHRLNRTNFVYHFHGPAALEARVEGKGRMYCRITHELERAVYARANYITTLSEAFKRILVEEYSVAANKVFVIPGGIDAGNYPLKSHAVPRTPLRLLTVRRLVHRMGVDALLRALALMPRPCPVHLRIAGDGPLRPLLGELVRQLGLQDAVTFLGRISDERLRHEYGAADLAIVPTRYLEGFGLVILEALACGTPVVGTRIGGIPEILQPLDPGLLIDVCTPAAIAAKLEEYVSGQRCLPSPATCRRYVEERYSWPRIVEAHRELYEGHFHNVGRRGSLV